MEIRERLRLELTRLEKEEKEEKDKIGWIELEKRRMCTNFPRKISEHEIKIRQVESSMKENADKLGALIKQKEKEKVEFEKLINKEKEEMNITISHKKILDTRSRDSEQKITQVQEQLKSVREDLRLAEGGEKVGELEGFMDQQILELESELKCPVCFEVAKSAPIYKCSDDHLICR